MKKLTVLVAVVALFAFAVPALAANPFMDVPMNSWAYDAVSQLASQGVISGYPDGTFKGNQPMTRYEMASIVARALAVVDMNKASKQDVEMLKRLVVEFKDELDALGVDVAGLDDRVAVLEENLGGWKFWGELRFDSYFADNEARDGGAYTKYGDTDWKESRFRLWMSKVVDDKVTFVGRVNGSSDLEWDRYYAVVQMPYEFEARIGKWLYDWEDERGFYVDNEPWFGDVSVDGYYMTRDFSMGNFAFYVAHNEGVLDSGTESDDEYFRYGAKADFNVTENLRLGLRGLMIDHEYTNRDENMYEGNFTFNFTPDIAFKGAYMMEDFDIDKNGDNYYKGLDDSPSAFRAIVDVSQEAFGFTSLWLEYASADDSFYLYDWDNGDGSDYYGPYDNYGASITPGLDSNFNDMETDVLFARLDQSWTDKWTTFQRYVDVSQDANGSGDNATNGDYDITNFTFGVKYQYTPALYFELAYDDIDYGSDLKDTRGTTSFEDDSMIRLRTHLYF